MRQQSDLVTYSSQMFRIKQIEMQYVTRYVELTIISAILWQTAVSATTKKHSHRCEAAFAGI